MKIIFPFFVFCVSRLFSDADDRPSKRADSCSLFCPETSLFGAHAVNAAINVLIVRITDMRFFHAIASFRFLLYNKRAQYSILLIKYALRAKANSE